MLTIRTVLHPTDFSKASECAFRLAGSLARDHGAHLIVVHVVSSQAEMGSQRVSAELKEKLWDTFHQLEHSDPRIRELDVRTRMVEGDPVTEILRLAEETDSDLIVMGTHGRSGLGRLLMGSVAEEVVRKARCPVVTVKEPVPQHAAAEEPLAEPAGAGLVLW